MDDVKKIFLLVNNLKGGGTERQVSYLSFFEFIDKLILIDDSSDYKVATEKLNVLYSSSQLRNKFLKLLYFIFIPFKLKKIGLDKNVTLVTFLQMSHLIGYFCKLLFGCKWVMTVRTNPSAFYEKTTEFKMPRTIFNFLLKRADKVISNSKLTTLEVQKFTKMGSAFSVYNGYEIDKILVSKNENLNLDLIRAMKDAKVLINVGRLHNDKAQWHLIRILPKLKLNLHVKLIFIGKGNILAELKQCCIANGLNYYAFDEHTTFNDNVDVFFLGFDTNPYKYYQIADLFVFPSIYEGLPNTPIEALICGIPCVLSDCKSGPREILLPSSDLNKQAIEPELSDFGVLMPTFSGEPYFDNRPLNQNEQIWYWEILKMLNNDKKLLQDNIATQNASRYNIEHIKEQWKSVLLHN